MDTTDRLPWERQRGESSRAYHGFCHYRDLGEHRSLDKAYRAHKTGCDHTQDRVKRRPKTWMHWSSRWGWVERSALYDGDLERQVRTKFAEAVIAAKERHARIAQAALTALTAPVRAMLDALQDPTTLERLTVQARASSGGVIALLNVCIRCAQAIPAVVAVERLSLGMTTDSIDVDADDRLARDLSFANRIAGDPEAVELAIALLDRVSGQDADTGRRVGLGLGRPS